MIFYLNSPPRIIIKGKQSQTCLSNAKLMPLHKPLLSITHKSFWNVIWRNLKSISLCHLHDGSLIFQKPLLIKPLTCCQQEVAPKPLNNENFKKSWIPNLFANFNALCMKPRNTLFRCRRILKVTPDIQSQAAKLAFGTSARSRKCVIKTQIYALMFFSNSDAVFQCRKSIFALHNTARGSQKGLKRGLGAMCFL